MILANTTRSVSSQLFGCGREKLAPLGLGHLHHLMFITELLLVWSVGHIDRYQTVPLNQAKYSKVTTCQLECDALTFRTIHNALYCV